MREEITNQGRGVVLNGFASGTSVRILEVMVFIARVRSRPSGMFALIPS
jgi:hypothetical protein